jgi:hypothetical protein
MQLTLYAAILVIILLGCQEAEPNPTHFDLYAQKSRLPILENAQSLCHGIYLSSNFSQLSPKWAVGKLTAMDEHSLTFQGNERNATIFIRDTNIQSDNYHVGSCYKIDMMNICRGFMMMVDSRYPSPVSQTFVMPEKVSCMAYG